MKNTIFTITVLLYLFYFVSETKVLDYPNFRNKFSDVTISKIVNGVDPTLERRFYVKIWNEITDEMICGGSIIQMYFVITAQRCFKDGKRAEDVSFFAERVNLTAPRVSCATINRSDQMSLRPGHLELNGLSSTPVAWCDPNYRVWKR